MTLPPLTSTTFHSGSTAYGGALASLASGSMVGGFVAARRVVVDTRKVALSAVGWGAVITILAAARASRSRT